MDRTFNPRRRVQAQSEKTLKIDSCFVLEHLIDGLNIMSIPLQILVRYSLTLPLPFSHQCTSKICWVPPVKKTFQFLALSTVTDAQYCFFINEFSLMCNIKAALGSFGIYEMGQDSLQSLKCSSVFHIPLSLSLCVFLMTKYRKKSSEYLMLVFVLG